VKFLEFEERTLIGPTGDNSVVQKAYVKNSGAFQIPVNTEILGSLLVDDAVQAGGAVQALGSINSTSHPKVIDLGPSAGQIRSAIRQANARQTNEKTSGEKAHNNLFVDGLYAEGAAGNTTTIKQAEFSYRDDDANAQYNTSDFKMVESRWQTMVRLNLATGGVEWDEPTVSYQGQDQLPWPGNKKWNDEDTLQQLSELTMFDTETGRAKDRGDDGGPYTDPKLGTLKPTTPKQGFTVIG
jgi:hypothetical protein